MKALQLLFNNFDLLLDQPDGVQQMKQTILQWAVQGKLVRQDPNDEPASELLKRIALEKEKQILGGVVPRLRAIADKPSTPVLPFDIPVNWCTAFIDDSCVYIRRGRSPKYNDESVVRVISQKCVQWSGFDLSRSRGIQLDTLGKYRSEQFLKANDLLWNSTGTGTVGRICLYPGYEEVQAVADGHVTVLRTVEFLPKFLLIILSSPFVQSTINDKTTGTTKQQELNLSTIRIQAIPIPPLAEQHRIVAKVDELHTLCDQLEEEQQQVKTRKQGLNAASLHQLSNAEDSKDFQSAWNIVSSRFEQLHDQPESVEPLRQAILQLAVRGKLVKQDPNDGPANELLKRIALEKEKQILGGVVPRLRAIADKPSTPVLPFDIPVNWCTAFIDDSCVYIRRGRSPKYNDESVVRVISQKCVQWSGFDLSRSRGIQLDTLGKYRSEQFLKANDLLWNSTGTGTVGRICLYPGYEEVQAVADGHVTVLRTVEFLPKFLLIILSSPFVQSTINDKTTGTTKQQELNLSTIRIQAIPIPPLAEQHRIVAKVDELIALCDQLEQQLTQSRADGQRLLQSILAEVSL